MTTAAAAERRTNHPGEIRAAAAPMALEGTAIKFEAEARIGDFIETVDRRALDGLDLGDVVLLHAHDAAQPLARASAGNLTLRLDATGLHFTARLPDTQIARDVHELVRARVLKACSFGFIVDDDTWSIRPGGVRHRHITRIAELLEVSIVTWPAYQATDVTATPAVRAASQRLAAIERRHRLRSNANVISSIRSRPIYGPGSDQSFWRDRAVVDVLDAQRSASLAARIHNERYTGPNVNFAPTPRHGTDADARARLATVEQRDVGTSGMTALTGAPAFIGELWADALRARAPLATALTSDRPLPRDGGETVTVPRITTGATAAVQATDNAALTETTLVADTASGPVATTGSYIDAAAQVVEHSGLGGGLFDEVVTRELAAAYGAQLEAQVVTGSGAAGQLLGLLNMSGIGTVSYVDASPTVPEVWSKGVLQAVSVAHTAAGAAPDLLVLHPRRAAYIASGATTSVAWPAALVESLGIPTDSGAGTEDVILAIRSEYVHLLTRPPVVTIHPDSGSGTLTLRYRIYGLAGLVVGQPAAVTVVSGTGLIAPTF